MSQGTNALSCWETPTKAVCVCLSIRVPVRPPPSSQHPAAGAHRGHTGVGSCPQPCSLPALARRWQCWDMWGKKLEKIMQTQLQGSCCAWKSSGIPQIFRKAAAAALAAVISCNRLAIDTTVSAKGKGGGGTNMHHLSMPGSSPTGQRCPGGMAVPTSPRKGQDAPTSHLCSAGAGAAVPAGRDEDLLGHLCW